MSKPSREVLQLPIEKRAEIAFKVAVAKTIDEHTRSGPGGRHFGTTAARGGWTFQKLIRFRPFHFP